MAITFGNDEYIAYIGDSISSEQGPLPGQNHAWYTTMNDTLMATVINDGGTTVTPPGAPSIITPPGSPSVVSYARGGNHHRARGFVQFAYSGQKLGDVLAANIAAWIAAAPTVIFLEFGTNQCPAGVVGYQATYDSALDQLIAGLPTVRIYCLSTQSYYSEVSSSNATVIGQVNTVASTSVSTRTANCQYIDIRTPFVTYENTYNTSNLAIFTWTNDGTHLTTPFGVGQWSSITQGLITFV